MEKKHYNADVNGSTPGQVFCVWYRARQSTVMKSSCAAKHVHGQGLQQMRGHLLGIRVVVDLSGYQNQSQ